MSLRERLRDRIDAVLVASRDRLLLVESKTGAKLNTASFSDVVTSLADLLTKLVVAVQVDDATGAEKRAAVLEAVGEWFDSIAAAVDVPYVPEFIERTVLDPLLKKFVLYLAGQAIDGVVGVLKSAGQLGAAGAASAAGSLDELQGH